MTRIYSKALDRHIEVDRVIGEVRGNEPGPTIIFTGGIHGNEPSGVFALQNVLSELKKSSTIRGHVVAIAGNLHALEKGVRYESTDLNRLWSLESRSAAKNGTDEKYSIDHGEKDQLDDIISGILKNDRGPFYFMDLHTTSSETIPFLTVNDSLLNRRFTLQYPVPIILGIEEYLDGPLLSYINELGYVAFGFEGGQHDDLSSIENHTAFIYLSLVFTGVISEKDIDYDHYYQVLYRTTVETRNIYEIYFRFPIKKGESFKMEPGYMNFEKIQKGKKIATHNGLEVMADQTSRIFMPLYQDQGSDGFFAIRRIPGIFLELSAVLRRLRFDKLLVWLPGISWATAEHDTLMVNRKVARFFAKQFFHLLGYRSRKIDRTHLVMKNREAASRSSEYAAAGWYNSTR